MPSQLLRDGDRLDITCAEIAIDFEKFVKDNPGVKINHGKSQAELLDMLKRAKE